MSNELIISMEALLVKVLRVVLDIEPLSSISTEELERIVANTEVYAMFFDRGRIFLRQGTGFELLARDQRSRLEELSSDELKEVVRGFDNPREPPHWSDRHIVGVILRRRERKEELKLLDDRDLHKLISKEMSCRRERGSKSVDPDSDEAIAREVLRERDASRPTVNFP